MTAPVAREYLEDVRGGRLDLFLRTLDNEYQLALRDDCVAAAARHGFEVRIHAAEDDAEKQVGQIELAIRGPDAVGIAAILVSPVRESVLSMVTFDAARAGIGCAVLNRSAAHLEALARQFPALPMFSVSADQEAVGRTQAEQWRRLLPEGGEVFYLLGSRSTSSARERLAAAQAALAGSGLRLVTAYGDWSVESGERAARRWLFGTTGGSPPEPSAAGGRRIYAAQNDAMASGLARGLAAAAGAAPGAAARPPVTGCDGLPDFGKKLVDDGVLAATVAIPPVAAAAVDALAALRGGGARPALEIRLPVASYPPLGAIAPRA